MIDLLGLDLDGTLLSKTKKINAPTRISLANLIQKKPSLEVMILTGRSSFSTIKYINQLNEMFHKPLVEYFCCYGGAKLYQLTNNKPTELYKFLLTDNDVHKIITTVEQYNALFLMHLDQGGYSTVVLGGNKMYAHAVRCFWYKKRCDLFTPNLITNNTLKINVFSPYSQKLKQLFTTLKQKFGEQLNILEFSKNLLEITHKDANKGYALEHVCKLKNIPLKRIAVVGDSFNDYAMFQKAQYAFAVNSAPVQLKKIATETGKKATRYRFSSILDIISERFIC